MLKWVKLKSTRIQGDRELSPCYSSIYSSSRMRRRYKSMLMTISVF